MTESWMKAAELVDSYVALDLFYVALDLLDFGRGLICGEVQSVFGKVADWTLK